MSAEHFTMYLESAESQGSWNGFSPFLNSGKLENEQPVVVLTRATLRFSKIWDFWQKVKNVSLGLEKYEGRKFSIGVGEWPWIQQATISIWQTQAEMLDYAYKNQKHKEAILLARKYGWFKEEMFARFLPVRCEGIWNGKNAENLI